MTKRYRGHSDLDTVPQAIANWRKPARRLSRVESLRALGLNVPMGEDVSDLADWECHLLYG